MSPLSGSIACAKTSSFNAVFHGLLSTSMDFTGPGPMPSGWTKTIPARSCDIDRARTSEFVSPELTPVILTNARACLRCYEIQAERLTEARPRHRLLLPALPLRDLRAHSPWCGT